MPAESAAAVPGILVTLTGVVLALIAASCQNLGPAIQKGALDTLPPLSALPFGRRVRALVTSRMWLFGLAVAALGVVPYAAAVAVSGVAVVQPVTGWGVVVVVWYGRKRLGERLGGKAALGAVMLTILPALITFSGVSSPEQTIGRSLSNLHLVGLLVLPVFAAWALTVPARRYPILLALSCVSLYSIFPIGFQAAVGLVESGGYSFPADLGRAAGSVFSDPGLAGALLIIVFAAGANAVGYYMAQVGLQRNPATRFNPVVTAGVMVAGSVAGILVFGQEVGRPVLYVAGMILAVSGVVLLAGTAARAESPAP